jgi:hypothetical protein
MLGAKGDHLKGQLRTGTSKELKEGDSIIGHRSMREAKIGLKS